MINKFSIIALCGCIRSSFAVVGSNLPSVTIENNRIHNRIAFKSTIIAEGSVKPPKKMYSTAVDIGAAKVALTPLMIFLLGIMSGCHISFGMYQYFICYQIGTYLLS